MSASLSPPRAAHVSTSALQAVYDRALLQGLLNVEHGLASAEAAVDIPQNVVTPIALACAAHRFDVDLLAQAAHRADRLAIPPIKAPGEAVGSTDAHAARYVQWATRQDVIDTATMLQLRSAMDELLSNIGRAVVSFAALAKNHRNTIAVSRTWLQHAISMPFGLMLAEYAAAIKRLRLKLKRLWQNALPLQFCGAAGILAALAHHGLVVRETLVERLVLCLPEARSHTHRIRMTKIASALAIAGTCGKVGRDVSLMTQTDVGEALEPSADGRCGSSSMPNKRNPVAAARALAALTMSPSLVARLFSAEVQENGRSAVPGQAEWPVLPTVVLVTSDAAAAIVDVSEKKRLREVLSADPIVGADPDPVRISNLFGPASYQGAAQAMIDRLLAYLDHRRSAQCL